MDDEYTATIRIRRPAKITTDERGRSVWSETVETAELELVSTGKLKQILESSDEASRTAIEEVVSSDSEGEGVLARDPATGLFEIISDADMRAFLKEHDRQLKPDRAAGVSLEPASKSADAAGEELSLVSTQGLRKVLHPGKKPREDKPQPVKKDAGGGFNPYDSG